MYISRTVTFGKSKESDCSGNLLITQTK